MKNRRITALRLGLLASLILCILSGCSAFPQRPLSPPGTSSPATLELQMGASLPEEIVLTWDPDAVAVEKAEVSVNEGGSSRTITITIQMAPDGP